MLRNLKVSPKDKEVLESLPKDPFIDVNDDFDYSAVVIEKPWGHEYSIYKNVDVDVWFLFLKPGFKTSMHCHPHKKSSLTVLGGKARVSTLNESFEVGPGDSFLIDKGVFHATEAISPRGIYLLESETPVNKKNLVRFDDLYGRTGKRYESGRHVQPRDESTVPSLYNCGYDIAKRIVVADVALKKIDRDSTILLSPQTLGIVLSGALCDDAGSAAFSCGDIVNNFVLEERGTLKAQSDVELLLIDVPIEQA